MTMTAIFIFLWTFAMFYSNVSLTINYPNHPTARLFSEKTRYKRDIINNSLLQPPKIVIDIQLSVKLTDDSQRLTCKATGVPAPKITWFVKKQDKIIEINDNDNYIIHSDGRLEFSTSQIPGDVYYCQAKNALGSVISRKAIVQKVHIPKEPKINYEILEVVRNEKAVISCNLDPAVYWEDISLKYWEVKFKSSSRKHLKIKATEGRYSVITTTKAPQFHIRNVTTTDFQDMLVRCVLGNKFAPDDFLETDVWVTPKESSSNQFHVSKITNFDMCQGKDIRVVKGSSIELPWCSKPTTETISWYKSEYPTMDNAERLDLHGLKYKMISERFGNLLISNADITEEGYYFVKSNGVPLKYYIPYNLRVTVNLGIEMLPASAYVNYGATVKLRCDITGYPVPTVNWYHNSEDLGPADVHTMSPTSRITTLTINATIATAGVYQCIAETRDATDNRLLDNAQMSAPVIISSMAPRLLNHNSKNVTTKTNSYMTDTLENMSSVINIECTFTSIPEATIVWYLDDNPIPIVDSLVPASKRIDLFTKSYSLQIDLSKSASIADHWQFGGEYRAEASNQHGKAQCTTLVFVTGEFRIRPRKDTLYLQGQMLSLKCYVISESPTQIIWSRKKNGKVIRLPDSHLQKVRSDMREFTILRLDKNVHQGIYTCQSNYKGKEISHDFNISIAKPPMILGDIPDHMYGSEKSEANVFISCRPRQKPDQPWYAWIEFLPFKEQPNHATVVQMLSNRQTNIPGITGEYDSVETSSDIIHYSLPDGVPKFLQTYPNKGVQINIAVKSKFHLSNITCVVQNHAGVIRKSTKITIVNIAFQSTPPPLMTVILGDNFVLNCSAKLNQVKTIITWLYEKGYQTENYLAVNTSQFARIHQLPSGNLVVRNISLTDPQRFMCALKSSISTEKISKVVKILIKVPATIIAMPNTTELILNTEQKVVCTVHGDKDDLSIRWYKRNGDEWKDLDNVRLDNYEDSKKLTHMLLLFHQVGNINESQYKCVAKNNFSKNLAEKVVQLNVVDKPGKVQIKQETLVIKDRSMSFEWSPPEYDGKMPILHYIVLYSIGDHHRNVTTNSTSITLVHLRPHQDYNINVLAVNKVGVHESNETIIVKTRQAVPDGPVVNLMVIPKSSTSLEVKWEEPDKLIVNGKILHYQLCYMEVKPNTMDSVNWPLTNATDEKIFDPMDRNNVIGHCKAVNKTDVLLSDLSKFTEYKFRVIVVNEAGPGPKADTKERTMEDYPERAPTQVICSPDSQRLTLEWNPPARDSINGVLKGYRVFYFRMDHQGEPDQENSASETKLTLGNLQPATNYTIQVMAFNNKGMGPPSVARRCATNEAPPNAPDKVKAYFSTRSCAIVAWTSPTQPNGQLHRFQVKIIQPDTMGQPSVYVPWKSDVPYFKYEFCDLKSSQTYKVSVVAFNTHEGAPGYSTISPIEEGRIISFSKQVVANVTNAVVLDCETIPEHAARKWYHNRRYIGNERSYRIEKLTTESEGIYECTSDRDQVQYNVTITPTSDGVPRTPKIEYHNTSNDSIFISWRSTGSRRENDPIISFIVRASNDDSRFIFEREVSRTLRAFNIHPLECGTKYNLEVFAKNLAGNSAPAQLEVHTRGTKPIIPDTNLIVMSKNPKSMCFNLAAFLPGQGCQAQHFRVNIRPSNQGKLSPSSGKIKKNISRIDFDINTCYNVTNLHPNTDYYYEIEASNPNGSVRAEGHVKTRPHVSNIPPTVSSRNSQTDFVSSWYFWIIISVLVLILIVTGMLFIIFRSTCDRSTFDRPTKTRQQWVDQRPPIHANITNNQMSINSPKSIILTTTPGPVPRNRKLPTPPDNNNVYHKGIPEVVKADDEDDDDLKPYATYESATKPDPMSSRHLTTKYMHGQPYMASQTNTYQYPDMMDNQQHPMPCDHPALKVMTYENDLKQPLLNQSINIVNRPYDKGYSTGELRPTATLRLHPSHDAARAKGRMLPIVPVGNFAESEAYRPGSSLCSSNTESSTKEELLQVFHNKSTNLFSSRLQERDEDGTSTARDNRSTVIQSRNIISSDDSIHQESYFESGSSDCALPNFTSDRPNQTVFQPITTRLIQRPSIPSHYEHVDSHPSMIFNGSHPPTNALPEEDEEEDADKYTNNFVVV